MLLARARIGASERAAAAEAAAARVLALPEVGAASSVMAFASFGTEIPTDPLVEGLLASARRVLMPLVDGRRLRAAPIASLSDLAPGYHGIREPAAPAAVEPAADVILVPGVAFDSAGRRLGYGGGFYDEFLAEARGLRVGYCFDCQIVDAVPAGPGDAAVEIVVTEARVVRITT